MKLVRACARSLMSGVFLLGAYNQLSNPDALAKPTQAFLDTLPVDVPGTPRRLVQTNAAVMGLAGTGLALGKAPRISALALAAALVPTTLAGHRFWEKNDPRAKAMARSGFATNVALIGGLLGVAAAPRRPRAPKPGA